MRWLANAVWTPVLKSWEPGPNPEVEWAIAASMVVRLWNCLLAFCPFTELTPVAWSVRPGVSKSFE